MNGHRHYNINCRKIYIHTHTGNILLLILLFQFCFNTLKYIYSSKPCGCWTFQNVEFQRKILIYILHVLCIIVHWDVNRWSKFSILCSPFPHMCLCIVYDVNSIDLFSNCIKYTYNVRTYAILMYSIRVIFVNQSLYYIFRILVDFLIYYYFS